MDNKSLETLQKFYWAVPFLVFFTGYQFCNFIFKSKTVITPALLGKTVTEALPLLTQQELNVRLLKQKENTLLPEGTILNQIPSPGQQSKPHQTVFIITSKQPEPAKTPLLTGLFYTEITELLKKEKITYQTLFIPTNQPEKLCIAQIPEAGEPVPTDGIIIYCATQESNFYVFPDFKGLPIDDVMSFLQAYTIEPEIFHSYPISEHHTCHHCVVKDQKPSPGACIHLTPPPLIQLQA